MSVARNASSADPDVLIIGAGASGAVAAKRLGEAGFRVVCLEQGGWPDYSKASADRPGFELTSGRDWSWNPNARGAAADYPVEESESDITALMWNGVGGGTVVYAAHWQRNLPSDFRVRTLDGVADDWPLSYEELLPFYQRVERDVGVSGLGGDTAFPQVPGDDLPLPAAPLGRMGRRVARAHNELGWHWWPGPNAIATRPYRRLAASSARPACGAASTAPRGRSTRPTGRMRSRAASSSSSARGCGTSSWDRTASSGERAMSTVTASSTNSGRPSPSWGPTGSERRDSCSPRPRRGIPTAWPTRPDSSASA